MKFPSVACVRQVTMLFITSMPYWQPCNGETHDRFRYLSYLQVFLLMLPANRRIILRNRDESH